MLDQWYYLVQGVTHGPVPLAQLRSWAAAGQLLATDLVCPAENPQWAAAGSVATLFHAPQLNPAPALPPTAASGSHSHAGIPHVAPPASTAPPANTAPPASAVPPVLRPLARPPVMNPSPAAVQAESFSFQSSPSTTSYASAKRKSQSNVTIWSFVLAGCALIGGIGRMVQSYQNAKKIEREREEFNRAVSPRAAQDYLNSPAYRKLNEDVKKRANSPPSR